MLRVGDRAWMYHMGQRCVTNGARDSENHLAGMMCNLMNATQTKNVGR